MFLIMDISWAVFSKAALQHAVREGTRYAVTYRTMTGVGQDASIKSVVQQNSLGMLNGSGGASLISILSGKLLCFSFMFTLSVVAISSGRHLA